MQAIALKVRSEGKEYKRQPLKAARGNVPASKAPAAAGKYASDADPGARPEQPVQVRRHTRVMQFFWSVAYYGSCERQRWLDWTMAPAAV